MLLLLQKVLLTQVSLVQITHKIVQKVGNSPKTTDGRARHLKDYRVEQSYPLAPQAQIQGSLETHGELFQQVCAL